MSGNVYADALGFQTLSRLDSVYADALGLQVLSLSISVYTEALGMQMLFTDTISLPSAPPYLQTRQYVNG
jgi:hypothetical protein